MKCPICGIEMEKGGIIADGAVIVAWHPEHEFEKKGLKSILYRDGKTIGQTNALRRIVKISDAWFCGKCNKVGGCFDVTNNIND